jgi:hypothetical protein
MATAVAVAAAVAVAGMPSKAQALGFDPGQLSFIVFGGDNEYYNNLGSIDTVLANPTTQVTLNSQQLSDVSTNASLGLKFSLLGLSSDSNSLFTGGPSSISQGQKDNTFYLNGADAFGGWQSSLASISGGPTANNPLTLAKTSNQSYTTTLGTDGSINGFMGFNTTAQAGSLLSLFRISNNGTSDVYTKVATATFDSASGLLTITSLAAIPVPAAVVLFGTGLIGLVGIARRSLTARAA